MLTLCRLLNLALLLSPALADVQEVWWNITYVEDANPDGQFPRRAVGVNGTWPPPPLDVQATDRLIVHAINSLDQPTSLHHHGMFFESSPWMDGAVGVTQCGIPPGAQFDYVIPIDTAGQWGTYWVHAHASGHYVDGLRAPFVIHPPKEVHTYDEEFTVILGDWYHDQHSVLMKRFISVSNPFGAEPVPESPLIYFAQNATYLGPKSGISPTGASAAVGFNENATLLFQPGKTYRLRIVNTAAFAAFFFWIDGHDMRIIEVDGTDVEESPIDLISITVAQRYSVLVTARNDTSANWAIHANMDSDMFDVVPPGLNPNATSSITYSPSAPLTDLGFVNPDAYHDVDDISLVPVEVIPQPRASRTIELNVTFETLTDGTNRAMFNQITYNQPLVPAILSEITLGSNATVAEAYGPLSYVLDHNEVVDIVIRNADPGKHPFHLHGHKVMIVARSDNYKDSIVVQEGQANPMRRDTIQIPSEHAVTLRVVADNPGVWMLHCHIEWHLESGLAMQFVEAPLQAQQLSGSLPPYVVDQCKALGQPVSGNAAGHASTTDLTGLRLGPYPQKLGWQPRGIGAMTGCVLAAVLGMVTTIWYTWGGRLSEEEIEHQVQAKIGEKERRAKFFKSLIPGRSA
ncbi:multicopper oxidase [Amanita thiersii Skay4041]|uniref:Multicopper oxidase n=1 Tax=Amanita thiersii Skay4041 TaxID=703135 RepID=A0A2A9NKB6_9AGAR|nr:multicopper oxidase [Amanita thiersii Skay4041]